MEQKQYWDEVSSTKEFTIPIDNDLLTSYVAKEDLILDVGCGYGRVLNELYEQGYQKLIGIDFSKGMIDRGHRQFPYLDLRETEGEKIELEDDSVDAVILFAVLTSVYKDEDQKIMIDEIRRVLRPGGILYISDYLLGEDERNIKRYEEFAHIYGTYGVFKLPEGVICRHHAEDYIVSLLKDFETKEFFPTNFVTMNGHKSKGFCYFGQKR